MKQFHPRLLTVQVFSLLLTGLLASGCGTKSNSASSVPIGSASTPKHISIGIQMSPAMALVMVAKDDGFFQEQGLDVELKGFTAGKFALQAFIGGSLDYAVAGEVPVTLATLQGNKMSVFAQVVERTNNEVRIVARRDGTESDPLSYFRAKKRKVATSFGGGPEFYTYNFMKKYSPGPGSVTIVAQKPGDMPASIATGSIDAIAVFDPFAFIAERQLGSKGVTFTDSALYSELYVLVGAPGSSDQTQRLILKALLKASAEIKNNPKASQAIVAKYTSLTPDVIQGVWNSFVFAPALTPDLAKYMTAEAEWAKQKGDVPATTKIPNFDEVILPTALRSVDSGRVKVK